MSTSGPRRSVWIVDDSPLDAEHARSILARDYELTVFTDGNAMLERFAEGAPDVLVLDWVMPGQSGLELCQFIRSREEAPRIAILLLTGQRDGDEVVQALEAGANDFLKKPYFDAELRARVAALLRGKTLLERVDRAEANVRTLLKNAPDALLAVDGRGRIVFANVEAERLLRARDGQLAGRNVGELLPELKLDALRLGGSESLLPLDDVRVGDQILSPTVRALPREFAATRTIALRDVTEHRRNEARRLDFYSIIAHDLRSPLSAMMLRTGAILAGRRGVLSPQLVEDVRRMDENVRGMVALINDFLDLARFEGAGYRIDRSPVDVGAMVVATVDEVRPLAEESQLEVVVREPERPIEIVGDRRRLAQVLTNLLSNAIKFTPPGGRVTVAVSLLVDAVEIAVEDTGRGIKPEALATIFERYSRAIDPSHPVAGTGLGLMIVREIVDAHGGNVNVRSEPGRGSSFTVRLPRAVTRRPAPGHILVVDDDAEVRESLMFLLQAEGYNVQAASDGATALAQMEAERPCAVLLDLMMPNVSGWDVLAELARERRFGKLPVCVISASVDAEVQLAGVTVLQKPIAVDALLDFVRAHCAAALVADSAA